MSFGGLKKQLNKANQILSEKVGGAKGTEYSQEFIALEKLVKNYEKMLEDLLAKSQEYLQPNSGFRLLSSAPSKDSSENFSAMEAKISATLNKHGTELGQDAVLGPALLSVAEAFMELAEERRSLDGSCKQNFFEPLQSLQSKDLKQISHHLKKLEGRRLDYDFKKRKGTKCPPEELSTAETKYQESIQESQAAIVNFFDSEGEHLQALTSFITANKNFHSRAKEIFERLEKNLQSSSMTQSTSKKSTLGTRSESIPSGMGQSRSNMASSSSVGGDPFGNSSWDSSPTMGKSQANFNFKKAHENPTAITPSCRVMFDFVAENESELNLKEGDVVKLIEQVDENWFFGEIQGRQGHFPLSYVEVLIPLPKSYS